MLLRCPLYLLLTPPVLPPSVLLIYWYLYSPGITTWQPQLHNFPREKLTTGLHIFRISARYDGKVLSKLCLKSMGCHDDNFDGLRRDLGRLGSWYGTAYFLIRDSLPPLDFTVLIVASALVFPGVVAKVQNEPLRSYIQPHCTPPLLSTHNNLAVA